MSGAGTVWVDADAVPRAVRDILTRAATKRRVPMIFVANRSVGVEGLGLTISAVQVPGGPDVADDHIAEHCTKGDLVITADIPLAARAVEKGAEVLTPYGAELDEDNVRERLSVRDFLDDLRGAGVTTGGPPPFSQANAQRFANALDRHLSRRRY